MTRTVAIVALPPVSMSVLGAIIDTLTHANECDGRLLYEWRVISPDGRAVALSGGAQLPAHRAFDDDLACDWLIVVAGHDRHVADQPVFLQKLARVAARTPCVSGVHHGVTWLALAGQLAGYRASTNRQFDGVIASPHIYEIDRDRATCAGGHATLDFMLAMIAREHGRELAERIADRLNAGVPRAATEHRRMPAASATNERDPRLSDALQLMQANLEEPLATDDLARLVGLSRRQLERLFRQHLDAMPSKYYLNLRLLEARAQLQRTNQSVVQISLACGFATAAHFSNAYRDRFGVSPREERRHWLDQQRAR